MGIDITFSSGGNESAKIHIKNIPPFQNTLDLDLKYNDQIAWANIANGSLSIWSYYGDGRYAGSGIAFLN